MIKNISLSAAMSDTCKEHCTMEKYCVSFNTGPADAENVLCQLSDSDSSLHPNDLRRQSGFSYRGTEVRMTTLIYGSNRDSCIIGVLLLSDQHC